MRHWIPIGLAVVGCIGGFALAKSVSTQRLAGGGRIEGMPQARGQALRESTLETTVAEDLSKIAKLVDGTSLREQWESFGDDARGFIGRQRVLARWAEVDPEGGWEYFADDWDTWISFLAEWALIDPQAAAGRLISENKIGAIATIAQAVVVRSPECCLELVAIWEDTGRTYSWADGIVTIAFAKLFADDREKALARAATLSPKVRVEAMAGIATAMARNDGVSASEWADSLIDPKEREAAIAAVAVEIGMLNPDSAVPLLLELDNPFKHGNPGALILEDMIKTNPDVALGWAVRHFDKDVQTTSWSRNFLSKSLWYAGEAATTLAIAETAEGTLQENLIDALSGTVSSDRIEEMLATVDGLSSSALKTKVRLALLGSRTGIELPSAVEYIESLPEGEASPEMWEAAFQARAKFGFEGNSDLFWKTIDRVPVESQGQHIAKRLSDMVRAGNPDAIERLSGYHEHPSYPSMANSVAAAIGRTDLDAARSFIESLADDEARGHAASSFASNVPIESVPQTFEWLQSLGLTENHMKRAIGWTLTRWARDDGMTASAVVLELEPGPVRQQAIAALISGSHIEDPTAALEWVEELDDPEQREQLRQQVELFRTTTERIGDR